MREVRRIWLAPLLALVLQGTACVAVSPIDSTPRLPEDSQRIGLHGLVPSRAEFSPDGNTVAILSVGNGMALVASDELVRYAQDLRTVDFGWGTDGRLQLALREEDGFFLCTADLQGTCTSKVRLDDRVHPAGSGIAISQDGHFAVIASSASADSANDTATDLWVVDLHDGTARPLTRTKHVSEVAPVITGASSVVFTRFTPHTSPTTRGGLYSIQVNGPGQATPVSDNPGYNIGTASAASDGTMIADAYVVSHAFQWSIVEIGSGPVLKQVPGTEMLVHPAISRDGQQIAAFEVGTPARAGDLVIFPRPA